MIVWLYLGELQGSIPTNRLLGEAFNHCCFNRYIKEVSTSANAAVTRGFCLALGALPRAVLKPRLSDIVGCLSRAAEIQVGSVSHQMQYFFRSNDYPFIKEN